MSIDDIAGTKAKSHYQGPTKDILSAKDIEGTSPKYEKVRLHPFYTTNLQLLNQMS